MSDDAGKPTGVRRGPPVWDFMSDEELVLDQLDTLTAERDQARGIAVQLEQELAELREVVAALHRPDETSGLCCMECGSGYFRSHPCDTLVAVEAVQ